MTKLHFLLTFPKLLFRFFIKPLAYFGFSLFALYVVCKICAGIWHLWVLALSYSGEYQTTIPTAIVLGAITLGFNLGRFLPDDF